ncbi:MAG TPA: SGNH/GDSL hydrolase family protein [Polyangiaceae bacterium]|nr:SGNH/GDSL hydrolase family protein [Polyangiaceae bacterium]
MGYDTAMFRHARLTTAITLLALGFGCGGDSNSKRAMTTAGPLPSIAVAPTDPHVRLTGRVDLRDAERPRFSYPGVSIELAFEGEAVTVRLADQGSSEAKKSNHYQVVVDGKPTKDLAVTAGDHEYELATNLPAGPHRVALYRMTESFVGKTELVGLRVFGKQAKLSDLPARPRHRLEIVGDSITCGYGDEARIEPPPKGNPTTGFTAENENHFLSYGAIAARELDAELYTECVSGIGVSRDFGGKATEQMPDLYLRTFPGDAEPRWNFDKYTPDAVIVNLGTNDFGKGVPDDVTFIAGYEGFVAEIRELYPHAQIVCVTGTMVSDAWPPGENRLSKLNGWVSGVVERRRQGGDSNVSFLALTPQSPPFGEDWHPTLATQRKMASELVAHLKKVLTW